MCDPSSGILLPPVFNQPLSLATSLAMAVGVKDLAQKDQSPWQHWRGAGRRRACPALELTKGNRNQAGVGRMLLPSGRPASENGPQPREALMERAQPGHRQ